jgi:hypothetical protein
MELARSGFLLTSILAAAGCAAHPFLRADPPVESGGVRVRLVDQKCDRELDPNNQRADPEKSGWLRKSSRPWHLSQAGAPVLVGCWTLAYCMLLPGTMRFFMTTPRMGFLVLTATFGAAALASGCSLHPPVQNSGAVATADGIQVGPGLRTSRSRSLHARPRHSNSGS